MSLNHSPAVVTDGLQFYYDAANNKNVTTGSNLLTSTDLSNLTYWGSSAGMTVTANAAVAPDGTMTAYSLALTGVVSVWATPLTTATIGTGQQFSSIYAKAATGTNYFTFNSYYPGDTEVNIDFTLTGNGTTSAPTQSMIKYVGNGWYLCTIFTPARVNAGTTFVYRIWPAGRAITTGSTYFWGPTLKNSFTDLVGNNTLTPVNNLSYSATNSGSMVFNGTSSYFSVPSSTGLNPTTKITMESWVKFATIGTRIIWLGKGDGVSNPTTQYWLEKTVADKIMIYLSFGASAPNVTLSNTTITTGVWYHIVATYDGATIKGYVNGVIDPTTYSFVGTLNTTSTILSIGRLGTYNGFYMNGNLPITKFYNRALSAAEVSQNFNALRGRFGI
jgi:hypothetical protein